MIRGTLPVLYNKIGVGATYSGLEYVERLVHSGLVDVDGSGTPQPTLAEAVPTLENGLWKVFPDGRMETTWKLRSGARWHDGTPLTAAALVFTGRVEQDKSLGWNYNLAYDAVDTVTAPDPSTVTVTWRKPFVEADRMFSPNPGTQQWGLPLPRHILERSFDEEKPKFLELPYWGPEFIGSGPFKLREMVVDDRLNLVASAENLVIPLQRQSDLDYMVTFGGFTERMQVLGQILRSATDQLPVLRLIYDPEPTMVSNRLKNVPAATPSNIEKWEVAGLGEGSPQGR